MPNQRKFKLKSPKKHANPKKLFICVFAPVSFFIYVCSLYGHRVDDINPFFGQLYHTVSICGRKVRYFIQIHSFANELIIILGV